MHVASACFLTVTAVTMCCGSGLTTQATDDAADWPLPGILDRRNLSAAEVQRKTCRRCLSQPSRQHEQNFFRFLRRQKAPVFIREENPVSSPLEEDHEIKMFDVMSHVRGEPHQKTPDEIAVLTVDDYNGQQTLVYKLAPGAIFRGVKNMDVGVSRNTYGNLDKNRNYGTILNNKGNIIVRHRGNSHLASAFLAPTQRRNIFRLNGKVNPFSNPLTKWKIHYVYPKPPLSSMENPYLPSKTERYLRSRTSNRIKLESASEAFRPSGSSSLLYPLAKLIQIARAKTRGAWVSFQLFHYLGFLPHVPGIPKHKDPQDVMTSIKNYT